MVQSIELLFDDETETALARSWAALADAGLPSLATHTGETNRPHVTVAVSDEGDLRPALDRVGAVLEGWDLRGRGFGAVVGSPVLFGGHRHRWVLARQVVPSRPLLTLHAALHRALAAHAPDAAVSEQTLPDRWTAHATLARRVPAERLGEALQAVDVEPLPCRFTGARLWDSVPKTVTPLG
ncbi:2'-5' RNA ligase family protein [Amnibacterium endophyticum]|uniref:2'-5' RNA ligase family protein n=1 Tax=Amnibacterium endophyticum TaxID=2109337 RepID=A0ABW4L9R5_9MICO